MWAEETGLPGCRIIRGDVRRDDRGWFLKTLHQPTHAEFGLRTDWQEEYVSLSHRGVVRGMHFQTPPADHAKLVTCLAGEVIDVVLDLRCGSPTFGEHRAIPMSGETGVSVYAPSGVAHGFAALRDDSMMFYKVTSVHQPANDAGISWDSFGFDWPIDTPIVSERDRQHPPLASFDSPFRFDPANAGR